MDATRKRRDRQPGMRRIEKQITRTGHPRLTMHFLGTRISNLWAWELLVSYGMRPPSSILFLRHYMNCELMRGILQLGQGPVNGAERRCEEDHEALQHPRALQEDVPGIEAAEAPEA